MTRFHRQAGLLTPPFVVVRAHDLRSRFSSTVELYVLIAVDESSTFETRVVSEETPSWNESFAV